MFDFLRDLTKWAEEKRQERLNAYVDGELSARERAQVEQMLAQEPELRAQVAQLHQLKGQLEQLPRVRAPRNFTLNPAVYSAPARQPAFAVYPALRVATALTAFFFMLAVVFDLATPAGGLGQPLSEVAIVQDEAAETDAFAVEEIEPIVEGEAEEVTRVAAESELEAESAEDAPAGADLADGPPPETAATMAEQPEEELAEEAEEEPEAEMAVDEAEEAAAAVEEEEAAGEPDVALAPPQEATATVPAARAGPTATASATPAPTPTIQVEEPEAPAEPVEGTPYLFIAELVLGVLFAALLLATLLIRRNL